MERVKRKGKKLAAAKPKRAARCPPKRPAKRPPKRRSPGKRSVGPAAKPQGGRPPIITPEVVEKVGDLMAIGVPEEHACALHGVNPLTFGPAVSRNPKLKAIMMRKHARFIVDCMEKIRDGGERVTLDTPDGPKERIIPWQGRAWMLERRYWKHFSKKDVMRHGLAPPDAGGAELTAEQMTALEKMAKAMFVGEADS